MDYRPGQDKCPLEFSPFKSCTVPRPIGWLSSIDSEGRENLAPYSQWQNLTFDPPMVMFAANQYPDGRRKDTVINAETVGRFVWNMATSDLRQAVAASAQALPADQNEFDIAGVERKYSDQGIPMVAASPAHFECKYISTNRFSGNSNVGTIDVVFAQVERIHVNDEFLLPGGKLDILKIKPLARMGYYDYTVVDNVFEMKIPGGSDVADAGLEGKA